MATLEDPFVFNTMKIAQIVTTIELPREQIARLLI